MDNRAKYVFISLKTRIWPSTLIVDLNMNISTPEIYFKLN